MNSCPKRPVEDTCRICSPILAVAVYALSAMAWLLITEFFLPLWAVTLGRDEDFFELFSHVSFVLLTAGLLLFFLKKQQKKTMHFIENQDEQFQVRKQFYELPFVGMAITSPNTKRWLQVNERLCQILGYPREELLQRDWVELTYPDDRDLDVALFTEMLQGSRDTYQLEKRFIRKDCQLVYAYIDVKCARNDQGEITLFFATIEDITERIRQQEELRKITRLYRVVSNISQAIVRQHSLESVAQNSCDIAVRDGGFVMAWMGLLQDDGRVTPVAHTGHADDYLENLQIELTGPKSMGPTATALREGRTVVCADIANDPSMHPWREQALALGYAASAAFPLRVNGMTRGVFNLYSGEAGFFDSAELTLLEEVAGDIAFAIGLMDAEAANKQTLAALAEVQSNLLLSLEAANLGMWELNLQAGIANVSDSYYTLLGYAPQSTVSIPWWLDHIHPEDRDEVQTSMQLQLAEGRTRIGVEYRIQHQDGSWRWLVGLGKVAERDAAGKPVRLIGVNMDITARIEAELQRERDSERAQALLTLATAEVSLQEKDLLQYGIDLAERITGSTIAFLHFVNEDQQTIELVTWSTGTMTHCHATYDKHYPIGQAGIWADCFRQRKAIICNDYAAVVSKKGVPDGHFPLYRFISVPTISNDKVQMIIGVGNRDADYTQHDVETVQLVANDLWRIVQRRRAEASLRNTLHEQLRLNNKLDEAHNQLLQSEKLAAIGQLAAGVAHELNNPIGFVHSNLGTLDGYVRDLMEITEACNALKEQIPQQIPQLAALDALIKEKDYNYIRSDLPQLISESKEGLSRVRRIVQDLKDFSRTGEASWEWADLHKGLDSTLNIVWNELKYKCTVHKEYGDIPEVYCLASQLNQVFMNLLVNASHAIEKRGDITIRTGVANEQVWIEISDTGKGIPPELLIKIFDPFFTTKPVGQGTGLGLSLSYSIMQRHHGSLTVRSEVGIGSTFRIELPVRQEQKGEDIARESTV